MAIYELQSDRIVPIPQTTFGTQGVRERDDLQRLLRSQIEMVSPDTLILAEEFGDWEDSKRRIDLLGVDKDANLVVIELKRDDDGGHMELQAIRYAAMVSTMTFEKAVAARAGFQRRHGMNEDAQQAILEHLDWEEPNEDGFGQAVRIVLVSGDFSRELTSSVMWLNSYGLDVRCVRLRPYDLDRRLILDVQHIIPLPEAKEYQIQLREKDQRERRARESRNDRTQFDVSAGGESSKGLGKGRTILLVARKLVEAGVDPGRIAAAVERSANRLWRFVEGRAATRDEFIRRASTAADGKAFRPKRWFCDDDELLFFGGRTYAFSNQWGSDDWHEKMTRLVEAFPDLYISYTPINGWEQHE
ncbi:MAG: hypothetical protein HOP29_10825 [Phycisphaerales bacterium]|nr:hypothetical protein [Phycisphaerales bacterium]